MARVERYAEAVVPTDYGPLDVVVYKAGPEEHVALVAKGQTTDDPWLVRVHSECWTGEVLRSHKCDCRAQLDSALRAIAEAEHGVLVYLRQEGRGIGLGNKIRAYALQASKGLDTVEANRALGFADDARSYEVAADILRDLGVTRVRLMTNNPEKVKGLERGGVEVTERVPLLVAHTAESSQYLAVKQARMGHHAGSGEKT
jgi:3,4-dihydroxy 2-butanone 4-phosphate synthase/GTP cyclohydrolase II